MTVLMRNSSPRNPRGPKEAAMSPAELTTLLAEHGVEQQELAFMIGYTPTTVCRWARGVYNINKAAAALIREALDGLKKGGGDAGNAQ
jgi:DNA-binding transcriptional regulator YiaG